MCAHLPSSRLSSCMLFLMEFVRRLPKLSVPGEWRGGKRGGGGGVELRRSNRRKIWEIGVWRLQAKREWPTCLLCKAPAAVARPFARLTGMSNNQRAQPAALVCGIAIWNMTGSTCGMKQVAGLSSDIIRYFKVRYYKVF
jgi:hypothetical protein